MQNKVNKQFDQRQKYRKESQIRSRTQSKQPKTRTGTQKSRFHIAQVQLQRTEPRKGSQKMPRYRTERPTTNI